MAAQIQASLSPYYAYRTPHPSPTDAASLYQHYHHQHQQPTLISHPDLSSNSRHSTNAYMNPILPQPAQQYTFHSSPHHGVKRSAPEPEDELERSSHISNEFKKLRLNNNNRLPQTSSDNFVQSTVEPPAGPESYHDATSPAQESIQHGQAQPPILPSEDFMTIDETPHKVFINDLDSEIAAIEAAERSSSQLFLPDFEKQIGAIPDHVLRSDRPAHRGDVGEISRANSQALVLYREPSSLTVPEEEDAVRKAVLEARRGVRERMRREQQRERETAHVHLVKTTPASPVDGSGRYGADVNTVLVDEDAMDFD